jgi:ParB/RepB/Spo0J family partition protein
MTELQRRRIGSRLPPAVAAAEVDVSRLQPNPRHPRHEYSGSDLGLLADSLRQHGQLAPLLVRRLSDEQYEIIAGTRRWRAASLAGLVALRCQVFEVDEDEAFVLALDDNLQHQRLTPLEEAWAYQELLDRGIVRNRAEIARRVNVTRTRITQRMKLLELDPVTQQKLALHRDLLTEYHGRLLREVEDLSARHRLADEAIDGRWSGGRLRARVEEWLRDRDADSWLSGERSSPRAYSVSLPGFTLSMNFARADLLQVDETLDRLQLRVRAAIAAQTEEEATPDTVIGQGG